ncbi:hypothetical protein TRICI_000723 [Trichomonascus ciferrii]|uniref:Uncharacterized protein n=1 Tax=Trichomonascus ciferrii TaxID=44093 RepID=A0A642VBR8_9ASCO|nr:hypothetical protein TRICI_000723 [Trichomonascus ciferrii]
MKISLSILSIAATLGLFSIVGQAADSTPSEVTGCHFHDDTQYCLDDSGNEGVISPSPKDDGSAPEEYTGCHNHGDDIFCLTEDGEEVQFKPEGSEGNSGGENCHFHAGVEHCLKPGESENESSSSSCERTDRDYNIPLRIGLIFVILATSAIGVYGPMVVRSLLKVPTDGVIFTIIKQFGTGVVISTAFVHLMTHAALMWDNDCLGTLQYESTSTAITMAGLFLAFLLEYIGSRMTKKFSTVEPTSTNDVEQNSEQHSDTKNDSTEQCLVQPNSHVSVAVMEAGIVFHSILIGITLVVAGDSFFITLFIVIIFHQMFEGLALGARITTLDTGVWTKILMGLVFALITPIGMAIGTGVLSKFNGNDPSTIIALGTLDAFSAGVLIWTGIVEMWAYDWIYGYLASSSWLVTSCAVVSLVAGMILMSVLGKWA